MKRGIKTPPVYRVTWEDACKNTTNQSRTQAELASDRRMITVTSVGFRTVYNERVVVLSQQLDHPDVDGGGEALTYRDHIKIPRGMVRRMTRLG